MPWPKGKPKPPETRRKLSQAMQRYWDSDEARDRDFPSLSQETKRKLSAAMQGRHATEETREKIRQGLLRHHDPDRHRKWKRQRGIHE